MRKLVAILSVAAASAIVLWFSTPGYTTTAPARIAGAPQRPTPEQPSIKRLEDNRLLVERPGAQARAAFVPGEVLVKFRDAAAADEVAARGATARGPIRLGTSARLTSVFERFGVSRARKPFASFKSASHRRVVKLISPALKDDPQRTEALAAQLQNEPDVEYAELNLIMRTQAAPNDPHYSSSGAWGQPFRDLWGLEKISAEAAWDTTRGENVVVAVIDTGVDYSHEDIAANIRLNPGETGSDGAGRDRKTNGVDDDRNGFVDDWRGWDFVTDDGAAEDNDPMDDHGHGTHVAGTIAAVSGNGLGIVGVAPAARVMALKGLDRFGFGTTENLSKAILYAADNGARVINASWGSFVRSPVQTFVESISYAHDTKGVVFVAAAGNSAADVGDQGRGFSPANIRDAIAVSAFDNTDTRAYFSNFGLKIDVAAPGGGDQDASGGIQHPGRSILSLMSSQAGPDMTGSGTLAVGAKYLRQMGTSMASPHAAGAAALILARHPDYSPEQVRQALREGSDDVGVSGPDPNSGRGRVNAAKALTVANPLAVQLTEPTGMLVGLTEVSVRGTAAGPGLLNWRLEYGIGSNPSSWTQITLSLTPVSEGQLALWDVSQLSDGAYTLRLTAQNNLGGTFEDRLPVRIDNIVITEPAYDPLSLEPVSFFRAGQLISIKGTVAPRNFSSYTIDVLDSTDRVFAGAKITLTNDGLQRVRNDVLGTWDIEGVPTDSYTIRLTVRLTNATFQEITHVIVDPTIHPGWPRSLGLLGNGMASLSLTNHLDAHDINGDGAKDLIVGYGNTVRIFDHTGAQLPGWPRRIDSTYSGATIQQSPAVGDLDGDGAPEIVASNNSSQIFIWRADGTPLFGWPRDFGGGLNSLAVNDLNNDGVNEIIAADWQGRVKVFNTDGVHLPWWQPPFLASDILLPVCVADLDGDRQKEVVVATFSKQTQLFVLRSNGTIVPGWPRAINAWSTPDRGFWSYPAVGDLDGDRDSEIVIGSGDGKVYAFHHTGADVSGWPQSTMGTAVNSPAVGDVDGDGRAEVVAGIKTITEDWRRFSYLYAWRGDGTPLAGWPVKADASLGYFITPYYGFGAPVIADVDGDRAPDIVASGDGSNFVVVRAYKVDGSRVAGFPKAAFDGEAFPANTVAVADLDNDGLLEMAWLDFSSHLYVWDLPSAADAPAPWPMFHHDARHTGALPTAGGISLGGRVTHGAVGLGGVKMTLTSTSAGFTPLTVSTDANGSYSLTDLPPGATYTVEPSKLGYAFTPASRSYSNLTASETGADFTAAAATFSIGGKVTVGGAGLGGVTVALRGAREATATTLGDGTYQVAGLPAGGSYTVKPSKAGYTFTPWLYTFERLGADRTADFNGVASPPSPTLVNVALASRGATVVASSTIDAGRSAPAVINGDRRGLHWGSDPATGSGWHDATWSIYPDWVEVTFPDVRTLHEVSVFSVQDNFASPSDPTAALVFTKYGVTDMRVEYWDGTSWVPVPGAAVSGNNKVWAKFAFAPLSTPKIRVVVTGALANHTRITEIEAMGEDPAAPPPTRVNHALASRGATASASSTFDAGRSPLAAINGDRRGVHWGSDPSTGSGWHDATKDAYPDWLEVRFPGQRAVDEISLYTLQDAYSSPSEPTDGMLFTKYGVVDFEAQYWTGSQWAGVPNGAVVGNDRVRRSLTFAPVTTDRVRVLITKAQAGYSRVAELEAWGPDSGAPPRVNVAAAANGATATASSTLDVHRAPLAAINGDRRGLHWGSDPSTGSGWHDATPNSYPDWLEVAFAGAKTVSEVHVFSVQDNYASPSEPFEGLQFTKYGVKSFTVEYWDGVAWQALPGGTVTGNTSVWSKVTFAPVTATKIRVVVTSALAGHSRITEVEAY
jgi:subtilisin family serine protease